MLFESDKKELIVYQKGGDQIAQFHDGKYETEDTKIIKTLRTIEGVFEVDLAGVELEDEEYFDAQTFKKNKGEEKEAKE